MDEQKDVQFNTVTPPPNQSHLVKYTLEVLGILVVLSVPVVIFFLGEYDRKVANEIDLMESNIPEIPINDISVASSTDSVVDDSNKDITTGIKGVVMTGPRCPGTVIEGQVPNCPNNPVKIELGVYDSFSSKKAIKLFSSKADGTFVLDIEAGSYVIKNPKNPLGTYSSGPMFNMKEVEVIEGKYTEVVLDFSSDIQ